MLRHWQVAIFSWAVLQFVQRSRRSCGHSKPDCRMYGVLWNRDIGDQADGILRHLRRLRHSGSVKYDGEGRR